MSKKSNFNIIVIITICTLIGKVLGILRDSLISYYYGTTADTDAFFLAMSVPTILLGVFTASTDSAIIPQYKRVMKEKQKKSADQLFSMIINSLSIIAIVVFVFIFFRPVFFVKLFAIGFNKENTALASYYLRIFAPIGLLHLWYCFFCTYNAVFKKNIVRSILAFSTNLIVIVSVAFIRDAGLIYLSFAYVVSNMVCAFLPMIEMHSLDYHHSFKIVNTEGEYRRFWILFLPIMGGALLNDVQQYVDKNLCSDIVGGISHLNYGIKLVNIFDSVLVVGLGVVILPILSDYEIKKNYEEFSAVASKITRLMIELLFPFLTLLVVIGNELVTLLYGRGKFNEESIDMVSRVLRVYAPLIVLTPLITIFSKFFHVKEKNRIPFFINLIGVFINIVLSIILKRYLSTVGVALATTIAMIFELMIYVILIKNEVGWEKTEINVKKLLAILCPTILIILLSNYWERNIDILTSVLIRGLFTFFIYLSSYFLLLREDCTFWIKKCVGFINKDSNLR